jgi:hypothetical protein
MRFQDAKLKIYRSLPPDVQSWWSLQSRADRDYWTHRYITDSEPLASVLHDLVDTFLDDTGDVPCLTISSPHPMTR